ncbi:hypothetical protein R1sor_026377 [Riccia sorocarpa]|uniref:Uncharacterized protein n=1 Tax=Riccia sorocarpa TaxID=122646 RepID=A0ABD3GGV9_9MARC
MESRGKERIDGDRIGDSQMANLEAGRTSAEAGGAGTSTPRVPENNRYGRMPTPEELNVGLKSGKQEVFDKLASSGVHPVERTPESGKRPTQLVISESDDSDRCRDETSESFRGKGGTFWLQNG